MKALLVLALVACKSSDSEPAAQPPAPIESTQPAGKPPDQMDERMRHCPLALDGATSTLEDIAGGVRFTITAPESSVVEVRRRARHIVEFAAKKTRAGHGEFDGKGGGRMKNCPVVTDHVTIVATDLDRGARLDITTEPTRVDELRAETRARVEKFPFVGAIVKSKIQP